MRSICTWPCRSRSRGHTIDLSYPRDYESYECQTSRCYTKLFQVFILFVRIRKTNNNHCLPCIWLQKKIMVLALLVPEIGKVNCIVTWPWRTVTYKVTRKFYASICYAIDFPDPKNLRNKKKILVLALIVPEIGKVNCIVTRDLDVLSRTRSRVNSTRLFVMPLTFLTRKTWETRKRSWF